MFESAMNVLIHLEAAALYYWSPPRICPTCTAPAGFARAYEKLFLLTAPVSVLSLANRHLEREGVHSAAHMWGDSLGEFFSLGGFQDLQFEFPVIMGDKRHECRIPPVTNATAPRDVCYQWGCVHISNGNGCQMPTVAA